MCRAITCRTCGKTSSCAACPTPSAAPVTPPTPLPPPPDSWAACYPAVTTGRQAETKPGLRVGRFVIG